MCPSSISSSSDGSDCRMAWRLARRVAIFVVPIVILLSSWEVVLWRTGEGWPISWVVAEQSQDENALFGRKILSQAFRVYKLEMMKVRQPEIVTLGSSRVMQFRDLMFRPMEERFYNAGGLAASVEEVAEYAELVETGGAPRPKVLILGVDIWWMRPEWAASMNPNRELEDDVTQAVARVVGLRDWLRQPSLPKGLWRYGTPLPQTDEGYRGIGLGGLEGNGFRLDGSSYHQRWIVDEYRQHPIYKDRGNPLITDMLRDGQFPFTPIQELDSAQVDELLGALRSLQARGTVVLVLLPPVSNEMQALFVASPELKRWWNAYHSVLPQKLAAIGVRSLSVKSPADIGLPDDYMLDGVHASEVFCTHILERLIDLAPGGCALSGVDRTYLEWLRARDGVLPVSLGLEAGQGV